MSLRWDRSLAVSLLVGLMAFGADRLHKALQVSADCVDWGAGRCVTGMALLDADRTGWIGGEYVRVTDFFDYVLVWNTGISYGLLSSVPVWGLGLIMGIAILALLVWYLRTDMLLIRCALMLIIGGAVSNALDRLLYGAVADFFHFHWQEWSFYIFNVADAAISLGVGLLILDMLGIGRPRKV